MEITKATMKTVKNAKKMRECELSLRIQTLEPEFTLLKKKCKLQINHYKQFLFEVGMGELLNAQESNPYFTEILARAEKTHRDGGNMDIMMEDYHKEVLTQMMAVAAASAGTATDVVIDYLNLKHQLAELKKISVDKIVKYPESYEPDRQFLSILLS